MGRAEYVAVTDAEALDSFGWVARREGIIPRASRPRHAFAYARESSLRRWRRISCLIINLSGRGDKDVDAVAQRLAMLG